ncbi:MAG: GIY-YIG nuclease family protein [Candidatus Hydrogenedentota bacterium]|uniref:DUF4357 domain-containing protein n=1 Tax=Sumerlaea chitinivorans TaxID=2250252 RepID=A0A2Z4Y7C9_SUMC1|nr:hypothetical protein BRCON_1971 [Candidatus Sumerlaea chitinivorans]MCX7964840.1 GIY-YIG nuclease family protein [Candidatus Sumerlaea chitinivorans]RMH23822.1 MAG: GIY-YIG nuclease family protein [Candidatus Hydrogenedentota bacterium]
MSGKRGFSVTIFIPTGEPEGLRIVEKTNWSGVGVVFPRAQFPLARQRKELQCAGVYILWAPNETGLLPRVYIGEGDPVLSRLDQHAKQKDFWTHAAVFTSKDQNLNKAHVQYLEARLVALANDARRAELDHGNVPKLPALSEAESAYAEAFLDDVLLCLPVVGVSFFEKAKIDAPKSSDLIIRSKKCIEARGVETPQGFIVRAGSQAAKDETRSLYETYRNLRNSLLKQGILKDEGSHLVFTQDYPFESPSAAAAVVLGRSANGLTEWKDPKGRMLKEIRQAFFVE